MEYLIKTNAIGAMSEDQFFYFCQENDTLRIERTANGDLLVQEPTGSECGLFTVSLTTELGVWNRVHQLGYTFGPDTGFTLPNTAVRSPDAAFIRKERWRDLPRHDRKKFAHICPDFVVELKSESDNLDTLKAKMSEYAANGCRLGWLIDPVTKKTYVYRGDGSISIVPFNAPLNGEDVLPHFSVDLNKLAEEVL
jgi:Uma2 family endonuclease